MKTYFKILDEYVKAWQYNGECLDDIPEWIKKLSNERDGWAFLMDEFGGDVYLANNRINRDDWIVSSVEGVYIMDDSSFKAVYDTEDNA